VGATSAAKLLQQYGGIEAILEAGQRGALKGWKSGVHRLFGTSRADAGAERGGSAASWEALKQLQRNRRLFSIGFDPAEVLTEAQRRQLAEHAQRGRALPDRTSSIGMQRRRESSKEVHEASRGDGSCVGEGQPAWLHSHPAQAAWAHPMHSLRWVAVEPAACRLQERVAAAGRASAALHGHSPSGLPVDVLCQPAARQGPGLGLAAEPHCRPTALMVCGPPDFVPGGAHSAQQKLEGTVATFPALGDAVAWGGVMRAVLPHLSPAMARHVNLLKREGLQVLCVPWWIT
jgi:hypothetical protein